MIATNMQIVGFIVGYYVANGIVYTEEKYANDPDTKFLINTKIYVCGEYIQVIEDYKSDIKYKILSLMVLMCLC
jgi:hypothetical protein